MIYLELFTTFFMIGLFTIGGGYAMLSLIQAQVVTIHSWIDEDTFTDIVAISQMTPGPVGINSATYIGYTVLEQSGASEFMCILGSFSTTLAAAITLMTKENFPDWKSWMLFAAAFIASWWGKANPIAVIIAGGILGLLLY